MGNEACYFCCFFGDDDDDEDEWELIELPRSQTCVEIPRSPIPQTQLVEIKGPPLAVDRIASLVKEIGYYRTYNMTSHQLLCETEIDKEIEKTSLVLEVKETLKAFYRITDVRQREHCRDRIAFLMRRYYKEGHREIPVYSMASLESYDAMYT